MKKLLTLTIIILPLVSFAQEKMKLDSINNRYYISATREVPFPKEEILRKIKYWAATHHINIKEVIKYESPELVTIRYISTYGTMGNYTAKFYNTLTIQIKDNKYKATISNIENVENGFSLESYILKKDGSPKNTDYYKSMIISVREGTKATLQSLHLYLKDNSIETDF